MGWVVDGLEPDINAVEVCRAQGLNVVRGDLDDYPPDWNASFDVITMSHAIEHVPDPAAALRRLYEIVKPGGSIWIALPNCQSLGFRVFRSHWRGLHAPYHLCMISRGQLEKLLQLAGFDSIQWQAIGMRNRYTATESGNSARLSPYFRIRIVAALTPVIRIIEDICAVFSPAGGEELVVVARRPGPE